MSEKYFTLRIHITGPERVALEIRDLENRSINEVAGEMEFTNENRARIAQLLDAARKNELSGQDAEELGKCLFSILFAKPLRREFLDIYRHAGDEGALLRLELDVDEVGYPEIAALPWEFMLVPPDTDCGALWLATAPNMIFTRRRAKGKVPPPIQLEPGEQLRIALAVSEPQGLGKVQFADVEKALKELSLSRGFQLLDIVHPATRTNIDAVLEKEPHIFHFIGHGRLMEDETGKEIGQVALMDPTDQADWVSADVFSELFNRHRPGLVVLQSCESGTLSTSRALVGIASQVVQQDIPAVAAMQFEVRNVTAKRFALEFYRRVADYEPVDKAAQEGRRHIALEMGYDSRDFATPVLFMRVREGRLFQRQPGDDAVISHKAPADSQATSDIDVKALIAKLTFKLNDIGMQLFTDAANILNKIESKILEGDADNYIQLIHQYLSGALTAEAFGTRWEDLSKEARREQLEKGPDYETLALRVKRGEIIPFLGSDVLKLSGYPAPSSPEVVERIAQKLDYPGFKGTLSMLSQYCKSEKKYSRGMIVTRVKEVMAELRGTEKSNPLYELLSEVESPILVISSSYDDLLEQVFREKRKKFVVLSHYFHSASDIADGKILLKYDNRKEPEEPCTAESISALKLLEDNYSIIYKICGYFNMGDHSPGNGGDEPVPLMIMENDFFCFSRKLEQLIPSYITKKFPRLGFLFFGYNLDEWQDRLIADTLLERCPKEEDSFTVCGDLGPYESAFWHATHKMVVYREKLEEFVDHLAQHMKR